MGQNDDDKPNTISRREFVKGAGASAAALGGVASVTSDAARAQQNPYQVPEEWDLEADVVVIGSGPTGLPAAIRARDAGASVIIVEANYDVGGHGLMNGGTELPDLQVDYGLQQ